HFPVQLVADFAMTERESQELARLIASCLSQHQQQQKQQQPIADDAKQSGDEAWAVIDGDDDEKKEGVRDAGQSAEDEGIESQDDQDSDAFDDELLIEC